MNLANEKRAASKETTLFPNETKHHETDKELVDNSEYTRTSHNSPTIPWWLYEVPIMLHEVAIVLSTAAITASLLGVD